MARDGGSRCAPKDRFLGLRWPGSRPLPRRPEARLGEGPSRRRGRARARGRTRSLFPLGRLPHGVLASKYPEALRTTALHEHYSQPLGTFELRDLHRGPVIRPLIGVRLFTGVGLETDKPTDQPRATWAARGSLRLQPAASNSRVYDASFASAHALSKFSKTRGHYPGRKVKRPT